MNSAQCDAINKKALVAGSVNTGTEGGWGKVGVMCAASLMRRMTVCRGPARSGKWPECDCCCHAAAAGHCGPGCVPPGSDCPEPAGSGPRRTVLTGGPRCSPASAQVPDVGGRRGPAVAAECPARPPAAQEGAGPPAGPGECLQQLQLGWWWTWT